MPGILVALLLATVLKPSFANVVIVVAFILWPSCCWSGRPRGRDLYSLTGAALRDYRRSVQAVFQDPYSSLNPRLTIARTVSEPLIETNPGLSRAEISERTRSCPGPLRVYPCLGDVPRQAGGDRDERGGLRQTAASVYPGAVEHCAAKRSRRRDSAWRSAESAESTSGVFGSTHAAHARWRCARNSSPNYSSGQRNTVSRATCTRRAREFICCQACCTHQ
jgi:ABC-type dipeptide/oligopeptide/nickel transport system ATPase subunit